MNYPQTVDELLQWPTYTARDSFGTFTVITGHEGTGACFWCGAEISGRRRYCKHRSGCWTAYQKMFTWSFAAAGAIKRAGHRCENCGAKECFIEIGWTGRTNLEVHHVVPLNGKPRAASVYNVPWNVICLCHACHMALHAIMREVVITARPTIKKSVWDLALERGQSILPL